MKLNANLKALNVAIDALKLYAMPESYHAITFMADPPAGKFVDDFSYVKRYRRKMPGKTARIALEKMEHILNPLNQNKPARLKNGS